jgi:hypothetical protein
MERRTNGKQRSRLSSNQHRRIRWLDRLESVRDEGFLDKDGSRVSSVGKFNVCIEVFSVLVESEKFAGEFVDGSGRNRLATKVVDEGWFCLRVDDVGDLGEPTEDFWVWFVGHGWTREGRFRCYASWYVANGVPDRL